MPAFIRHHLLIALLSGALAPVCLAQNPDEPGFRPADWNLDPTPLTDEKLGLQMYVPAGAQITPTVIGENITLTVQEPTTPPLWSIRIQRMVMRNLPDSSAKAVCDLLLRDFERGTETIKVLDNSTLQMGGRPAHQLWVEHQSEVLDDSVAGFIIAQTGAEDSPTGTTADRFMIFRVATYPMEYERVRRLLEPSLATVRLSTAEELRRRIESEFQRAEEFISSLTPQRLRSLIGISEWYRIYQEDPSGEVMADKELGYIRVEVTEDARGRLNPSREPANYGAGERETGLLVAVDGRYVEKAAEAGAPAVFADLQVRMWQAWDRSEEAWQVRVTHRQGAASRTESEIGTRSVPSMGYSKLRVVKGDLELEKQRLFDWSIEADSPYISQCEAYLLGWLLPRDGSITGALRFHAYQDGNEDTRGSLPVRVDKWNPAADGSGRWVLESRPVPDLPSVSTFFDRHGAFINRRKGIVVTVPIAQRELLNIWRRKGLPTGN